MYYFQCSQHHLFGKTVGPTGKPYHPGHPPVSVPCIDCKETALYIGCIDGAQQAHLEQIRADFALRLTTKYVLGALQHGGKVWRKPDILDMLTDELVDAYVYSYSAKQQAKDPSIIDPEERDIDAQG